MANKDMKTIKFGQDSADTYVVADSVARAGLNNKQDKLISGTNIKTVNNQSLLGSGNIDISGGGSYVLPIASSTTLGGIKVGSGLTINSNGVLSANGGGGSSSMLVIEPTPVVYENLTWNQVLEKAFDTVAFEGIQFNSLTPSDFLVDSSSSFTLSNSNISIVVSVDTVTVNVGTSSMDIYSNGSWYSKSDTLVKDDNLEVAVKYINDNGTISLEFVNKEDSDYIWLTLDTTDAASIKNISSYVLFANTDGSLSSTNYVIYNANITCDEVIFDSTFENNLVNDTYIQIGQTYDSSIILQSGSGACYVKGSDSYFYNSGWQSSATDLGNGCSWNLSTYTLTFPESLKLWVESSLLSNVSNNITFKTKISGGEIIIPDASDYSNQLAEIKDTINNVDLIIYSTGSEWKFASDVLQLNQKQFNSIPAESNSLYGISVENRWCLNPDNGLPAKIHTGSSSWSMTYYQNQFGYNTIYYDQSSYVSSFMNIYYNVTSLNNIITFDIESSVYLSNILINVSDTVPTITFNDASQQGATFIFKQDGTVVSSLTFAQDTYYKLTLNGANFNDQYVIFVDCQSYTKSA